MVNKNTTNPAGELTATTRGQTIASRYLEAISCGGGDVGVVGGGHDISAARVTASWTPVTPERHRHRRRKVVEVHSNNDSSCAGTTATATTSALDTTSASWTTVMETPTRSDAASSSPRKSGNMGGMGFNNRIFSAPDEDDHPSSSSFGANNHNHNHKKGPLGIEDDCSSIDSSSSHRQSNRPAHLAVEVDDDSLFETSFEQHDEDNEYSPPIPSPALGRPSPPSRLKRARPAPQQQQHSGGSFFSCTGPGFTVPKNTDNRHTPSPPTREFCHQHDSAVRTIPSLSPYPMHRVVGALGWKGLPAVRGTEDEQPAYSEAGAPTVIMANRSTGKREETPSLSGSGASTVIVTNRTRDILQRHFPSYLEEHTTTNNIGLLRKENMASWKWKMLSNITKNRPQMQSLMDEASTVDDDDRAQMRALFDVHSVSASASQSTDSSKAEEPIYPHEVVENTPTMVGVPIGSTGTAQQTEEGKIESLAPVRFYMKDDSSPPSRTVQATNSSENTASLSTTDDFLLPDATTGGTKRKTTFVRYNARMTPNAHEVFQRRLSDSSNASTLSTSDKDDDRGNSIGPQGPIQPLFSLDRLNSYDSQSPTRKFQIQQSQYGGMNDTAHYNTSGPTRSQSSDAQIKNDSHPNDALQRRTATPTEDASRLVKSPQTLCFAMKNDSDQSIQPDPIFCPEGSISYSFSSRSVATAPSFDSNKSPPRSNHNQGPGQQTHIVTVGTPTAPPGNFRSGLAVKHVPVDDERSRNRSHHASHHTQSNDVQFLQHGYNVISNGSNSVKHRIQDSTLPDKRVHNTKQQHKKGEFDGMAVYDEKKEESNVDLLNHSMDSTTNRVRSLRGMFEKHEVENQRITTAATKSFEDEDSGSGSFGGSVRSLRDKIEQRISAMGGNADVDDDNTSVRSLVEQFETPRKRSSGQMVNHLRSRYESKVAPKALPKFRASGIDRASVRPLDSSVTDDQLAHVSSQKETSEDMDTYSRSRYESNVAPKALLKFRASGIDRASVRPLDSSVTNVQLPHVSSQKEKSEEKHFIAQAAVQVTTKNPPRTVSAASLEEKCLEPFQLESRQYLDQPGDENLIVRNSDNNYNVNTIYPQKRNLDRTPVNATGGSRGPNEDKKATRTHNGQDGVGPAAPKSFLSMTGRLLKFSKAHVQPTIKVQPLKPVPPTMQQRLHRWAQWHQTSKREPLASLGERIPKSNVTENVEIERTGSNDLSSVSNEETLDQEVEDKLTSNVEVFNRPTKSVMESQTLEEPSASYNNYSFGSSGMERTVLREDEQRLREQAHTSDGHSRTSEIRKNEQISRHDPRGKSMDTDNSDGVTLDASIEDVSILTDPIIGRDTEQVLSFTKRHVESLTQSVDTQLSPDAFIPDLRTLSDEISVDTAVDSLDANLRALECESVSTENAILSEDKNQAGGDAYDSGRDKKRNSKLSSEAGGSLQNATLSVGHECQKVAIAQDSSWDIEQVSNSFSFQTCPSKDGDSFPEIEWPPVEGNDWIDFSANPLNKTRENNGFRVTWDGGISSVTRKNVERPSLVNNQKVGLHQPDIPLHADPASPANKKPLTNNGYYTHNSTNSPRDNKGTLPPTTPSSLDKDHEAIMAARHEMLLSRQRSHQQKKAARERPDGPAKPPGRRMSDLDPLVTPFVESAKPRSGNTTVPRRSFFGRTNPPSSAALNLIPATPPKEIFGHAAPSVQALSLRAPEGAVHSPRNAKSSSGRKTMPPAGKSISAGPKPSSFFLSRITDSIGLSNSNNNNNNSSKHETLVARLKSVKASRLRRKNKMAAAATHQVLLDDRSADSSANSAAAGGAGAGSQLTVPSASRRNNSSLDLESHLVVIPSSTPARPLVQRNPEISAYQAAQVHYGGPSSSSRNPNRKVR